MGSSEPLFDLKEFKVERVLSEDPLTHNAAILGYVRLSGGEDRPAIVRVEKAAMPLFSPDILDSVKFLGTTDAYSWGLAWLKKSEEGADIKISVICPATEVHIRKYSAQKIHLVHETPEMYERIVKPYIHAFPPSRTQWVEDILDGRSEVDSVLFRSSSDAPFGFVILPDMKWDGTTTAALYLLAITLFKGIRTLRDLTREHIGMLKEIRQRARQIVKERYGLESTEIRCYVHYQPSYYHFHVHIVNTNYVGLPGMSVGQAHLLDDIISLLELDPPDAPSILQRMTLSYGLGDQHGLFAPLKAAQAEFARDEDSAQS